MDIRNFQSKIIDNYKYNINYKILIIKKIIKIKKMIIIII